MMTETPGLVQVRSCGPEWVIEWLSQPRYDRYLKAAGGDPDRVLPLYQWNAAVSAAALHDLAALEIGLRNAYDRALTTAAAAAGDTEWADPDGPLFVPLLRRRGSGQADVNAPLRRALTEARRHAGPGLLHGKIVAELTLGFWRYLSTAAHEKTLWVPHLHKAFPPGTQRNHDVNRPVTELARFRNRAAHHEPLLEQDLPARHGQILALAGLLNPDLRRHLAHTSLLPTLFTTRPAR